MNQLNSNSKRERQIRMPSCWLKHLGPAFQASSMKLLRTFLQSELKKRKHIFPPSEKIFNAFQLTPFDRVKVIILGQDPYHGSGQAHGLSFSVPKGVLPPPSLLNIFKELKSDLGVDPPAHGSLESWARQGVLLLNSVLTVECAKPASHRNRGWEEFTDGVISVLSEKKKNLVFILWGAYAQKKGALINKRDHCLIKAPHPSPLSAHRGFFGSRPFSQTNSYLKRNGHQPIQWDSLTQCPRP